MKALRHLALAALACGLTSCLALPAPRGLGGDARVRPPGGLIYSSQSAPVTIDFDGNPVGSATKKVSSSQTHWFQDILLGTGSYGFDEVALEKIAREGGIEKISYVDYDLFNILGVYQRFTVNVHGN